MGSIFLYYKIFVYVIQYHTHMYDVLYSVHIRILIGWQAYRGDQTHRKNSPT